MAPNVKLKISEEAQSRNTRIKEDIVKLLAETVSRPSDTVKQKVSRRCQALASFMETLMKETYEMVMKKGQIAGASFCSKPYRFLVQNGCYILLETQWTSFVNPWSRKLEFVVGHHRAFQGK